MCVISSAAVAAVGFFPRQLVAQDGPIRPFKISVPEKTIVDLRRRINDTRWADKETVGDGSQGVQLVQLQELTRYWGED